MKKITALLFLFLINFNSLGFLSKHLENCLAKHREIFKKFELEASYITILPKVEFKDGSLVTNFIYIPKTKHLEEYINKYENLKKAIVIRTIIRSVITGVLSGLINGINIVYGSGLKNVYFSVPILIGLGVSGILTHLGNNEKRAPEPYFDLSTLTKKDNIFDHEKSQSEAKIIGSLIFTYISGLLSSVFFATIIEKIKKWKS